MIFGETRGPGGCPKKDRKTLSLPDEMRHDKRDLEGDLDHTGKLTVPIPGGLVDQFLHPGLFDRVNICLPVVHNVPQLRTRRLGMAVQDVRADERLPAILLEGVHGLRVHLDNRPLLVADRDRGREFFDPGMGCHRSVKLGLFQDLGDAFLLHEVFDFLGWVLYDCFEEGLLGEEIMCAGARRLFSV